MPGLPAQALAVPAAVDQYTEQPPPPGPGGTGDVGDGRPASPGPSDQGGSGQGGGADSGSGAGGGSSEGGGSGPAAGSGATDPAGDGADAGAAREQAIAALAGAEETGEAGGSDLPLTGYGVTPFVLWIAVAVGLMLLARLGYVALSRLRAGI